MKLPLYTDNVKKAPLSNYSTQIDLASRSAFDRITNLAAQIFQVPIVLICSFDQERAWVTSSLGLDLSRINQTGTFCAFTWSQDETFVVPDTKLNPHFATMTLVTAPYNIRFYAGAPLKSHQGLKLGSLCLMDTKPRHDFGPTEEAMLDNLVDLAKEILTTASPESLAPIEATPKRVVKVIRSALPNGDHRQSPSNLPDFVQPLQLIMDTIPQSVFWKDRNFVYVWCNRNFALDAGVGTPENIVGKSDYDLPWAEKQAALYRAADRRVMETDTPEYHIIEQQTLANGKLVWVETSKIPIHDTGGNVAGVLGIYRDITERKQDQEELRKSQEMLQLIMDNIPQSIFWKDRDSIYLGCNRVFALQAGLNSPEEIVGMADYELAWGKDQADLYREMDRRVMVSNTPEYHIIEPQTQADGRQAWLDTNKIPLHDAEGNVVGILGTYEDITDRKESEQALKKAHDELERLVEAQTIELSTATAQLKRQISERKRSQMAEQEQRTLAEALRDTAALLNSTLKLNEVLDRILSEIGRVVPHDTATIVFIEADMARTVRARSEAGHLLPDDDGAAQVPLSRLPNHQHIIKGKQPFIIHDTKNSAVWIEQPQANWIRSYLGAPIRFEDEVIGLINLYSATPGFFGPIHAERLQAFTDQAAIAIQNARLYERARELAALQERQRLARDLHDAVSQTLWTASLIADVLPTLWVENQAEGQLSLKKFRRLTRGALAEMRTLLLELRPTALVEAKLGDLLHQLAEATMSRKKLDISVSATGETKLPPDVQVSIYRIAQEALNNVAKHSRATYAAIDLCCAPEWVELKIADNGRGFNPNELPAERLGIGIMRERAISIQANLQINSQVGAGTEVVIIWPDIHHSH